MSLELKISQGNARQALEDVAKAVDRLKAALDSVPQATKFNNLIKALNGFTGISATTITSVERLAVVVNQLGAARDLGAIAKGLSALGRLDMSKVTANVERLSSALRNFTVPRGLEQAAASLDRFGRAAQSAGAETRSLTASLRGLKVPAGIGSQVGSINKLASSFGSARSSAHAFGSSILDVNGLLAGFGITLGTVGFARFVGGLNDAEKQMASFRAIVDSTMRDAGGSAASLSILRKEAYDLGLPLRDLVDTYPKFAASLRLSGQSADTTNQIFKDLSVGLAGVGADAIKTQRVFKAVEQMFNKGTVTAEELKQQLGDAIPGAVNTFAASMGVSTASLAKMMEAGQVSANNVAKFAALLAEKAGPAAEAMAKTWIGASNRMASAWFELQTAISTPFFEAITPSVNNLVDAILKFVNSGAAASMGAAFGTIAAGVVNFGAAIVNLMNGPLGGLVSSFGGVVTAALALGAGFKVLSAAAGILGGGAGLGGLVAVLGRVGIGVAGLVTTLAPFSPMLAGIAIAITAAVVAYNAFTGSTDAAANAAQKLYVAASGVSGPVDTMGEAMYIAAHATDTMGVSMTQVAEAQRIFAAEITVLEGLVEQYNAQLEAGTLTAEEAAKKMEEVTARMVLLQEAMQKTTKATEQYKSRQDSANNSTIAASSAASTAASGYSRLGSSMSSATSRAQQLDQALSALAATAREAQSSTSSTQTVTLTGGDTSSTSDGSRDDSGFGLGGSLFGGSMFSGGGISHKGTSKKFRLPSALWNGAPSYAGGTANTSSALSGGGIPAILHPNEAVVPLTGGGSIPIAGGGGGAGMQVLAGGITQLVTAAMNTQTEVARVKEAVQANTSVLKNAIDKVNLTLQGVASGINTIRSSGSSSGSVIGSSAGGGTLGLGGTASGDIGTAGALAGGVGGSGALYDFAQQANQLSSAVSDANSRASSIWNNASKIYYGTGLGGNNPGTFVNPADRQAYSEAQASSAAAQSAFQNYLWSNPTLASAYYKELAKNASDRAVAGGMSMRERYLALAAQFASGVRSSSGTGIGQSGYAKGSPNAWKDERGGFQTMLHPDEAVIPLPDGRSVPVQMPSEVSALFQRMNNEYRGGGSADSVVERSRQTVTGANVRGGSSAGGNVVKVDMHITATDAASFSKSKAQIMQQFKAEFDRVASRYGTPERREDPTRRNKRT